MDTYSFILKSLYFWEQEVHESQVEHNNAMGDWKLIVLYVKFSITHVLNP